MKPDSFPTVPRRHRRPANRRKPDVSPNANRAEKALRPPCSYCFTAPGKPFASVIARPAPVGWERHGWQTKARSCASYGGRGGRKAKAPFTNGTDAATSSGNSIQQRRFCRSEERRVGKECVSPCRSWCSRYIYKKKKYRNK